VVLDATAQRMLRTDFELFFQREEWFRQHNLPHCRGNLFWGYAHGFKDTKVEAQGRVLMAVLGNNGSRNGSQVQ
jgi:hypothetical protein